MDQNDTARKDTLAASSVISPTPRPRFIFVEGYSRRVNHKLVFFWIAKTEDGQIYAKDP